MMLQLENDGVKKAKHKAIGDGQGENKKKFTTIKYLFYTRSIRNSRFCDLINQIKTALFRICPIKI